MTRTCRCAKLLDTLRQIEAQVTPGDYDAHWSAIRMAGIASAALRENEQCQLEQTEFAELAENEYRRTKDKTT